MSASVHPACSLTVAPNGARRGKADHAGLPLSAAEIAAEARACEAAGAAILHLHVRDAEARHTLDVGRYREAIAAVREVSGLIVQPTTERVGICSPDDMMTVFRGLQPEMISLNLTELLGEQSDDDIARARDFLAEIGATGCVPQYIVYNHDELDMLLSWHAEGHVLQARPLILVVLGRKAGSVSRPGDLVDWRVRIPADWHWGSCAFGAPELACAVQTALLGGHCRTGFENNLVAADGTPLADNAEQVGRLAAILRELGMAPLDAAATRTLFGLARGGSTNCRNPSCCS